MANDELEIVLHDTQRCTGCGAQLRAGTQFCSQCGSSRSGSTDPPTVASTSRAATSPGDPGAILPPLSSSEAARTRGRLPQPRPPRQAQPQADDRLSGFDIAVTIFEGIFSLGKGLLWLAAIALVGLMIFGYSHAHTDEFKVECAIQQLSGEQMSFPDNVLCEAFY